MNKPTKVSLGILALLAGYAATYVGNSLSGGYRLEVVRDGKHRWPLTGFSIHDAVQWQPRFGYVEKYDQNKMGAFFYPLIRLDQTLWHKTLYISRDADFTWITQGMPVSHAHPSFRANYIKNRESGRAPVTD